MRPKNLFDQRFSDELKGIEDWFTNTGNYEEIQDIIKNAETYDNAKILDLFKDLVEWVYGWENLARNHIRLEQKGIIYQGKNLEEIIENTIASAFHDFLAPINLKNYYFSIGKEVLIYIYDNTNIVDDEEREVCDFEHRYTIFDKGGIPLLVFIEPLLAREEKMKDFTLKKGYSELFQVKIHHDSAMRNFIDKGSRKERTFKLFVDDIIDFEKGMDFFEKYMIEMKTGVFTAWKLYEIFEDIIQKDEEICDKVSLLSEELSSIHNMEMKLFLLDVIREVVFEIQKDAWCDISKAMDLIIMSVMRQARIFNSNYEKLFYILIYTYRKKEKWQKLKFMEDVKTKYCMNLLNEMTVLGEHVNQGKHIQIQQKFDGLYNVDSRNVTKHKWYNEIWTSLNKGQKWVFEKSNFAFMKVQLPILEYYGKIAELNYYNNFDDYMESLNKILETIISLLLHCNHITHDSGQALNVKIEMLYKEGIIPSGLKKYFVDLCKEKDCYVYERDRELLLQSVYCICEWFMDRYGNSTYQHCRFVIPKKRTGQQMKHKRELQIDREVLLRRMTENMVDPYDRISDSGCINTSKE